MLIVSSGTRKRGRSNVQCSRTRCSAGSHSAVLQNQIQSWKSFCSAAESDPVLEVILQCCRIRSSPGSHSAVLQNQIQSWKSFCSAAESDPVLEVALVADSHNHSPRDSHDHSPTPGLHVFKFVKRF